MLTYLSGGTFSPGTAVILSRLITRKDLNGFHTYAQNRQSRHWVLGKCMHTPDRQAESCQKDAKRDMGFIAHTHRDFMNARMQKGAKVHIVTLPRISQGAVASSAVLTKAPGVTSSKCRARKRALPASSHKCNQKRQRCRWK